MSSTSPATFTFVDLFAGVGGFHAALKAYGGKCRYAVEIDPAAAAVYERNWGRSGGRSPLADITEVASAEVMDIPSHDILAAGFPCQPFSKSGAQRGMDETRGTLFWNLAQIITQRKPKIVLLENVRNLAGPRHLHEWQVIIETLREEGYRVSETPAVFSPHLLPPERGGRPQVRERVFITATHNPAGIDDGLPVEPVAQLGRRIDGWEPRSQWNLEDLLDDTSDIAGCGLKDSERRWIDAWDEFVQLWYEAAHGRRPPGFPIWADAWADYDKVVRAFDGEPTYRDLMDADPELPRWKAGHLAKNYALYGAHRTWIDTWSKRHDIYTDAFPVSRRKLEWQAQDTPRLWDTVMHLRPSGIRAKAPTYLPALVAITQTSIIGPRKRRVSPREAARMQGLPNSFDFGDQRPAATYKQMGNGVNVAVVWHILREHVARDEDILKRTAPGRRIIQAVLQDAPRSPDQILEQHVPAAL
ncbi:DNA cytosine methyltransferase [Nocardioides dongxiaopingii]|uniref:DNA cytosine methyltransferase n=1 Tax=Nocardioides sp. S-1144 TaxID=2582905 RepID=UPI00110D6478|nr:DNA cytosine methyltransferase [Nocardioides sp. S-1144]QCW51029.1 DNA cytosine methyltransferase [Nocardioides sp. S-1144]